MTGRRSDQQDQNVRALGLYEAGTEHLPQGRSLSHGYCGQTLLKGADKGAGGRTGGRHRINRAA